MQALAAGQENGGNTVETLDKVVIIGSNQSNRTALSSASPVEVISGSQLLDSGESDLSNALQKISSSFHFPQAVGQFDSVFSTAGAALKGLRPKDTLILINGKRPQLSPIVNVGTVFDRGSQSVDINAIPVSLIERVEILKDGASAQYGSDAIAGVINIILREADEGGAFTARVGKYTKGDGFQKNAGGWIGRKLGEDGFLTLALDSQTSQTTNTGLTDSRVFYGSGDAREATASRQWLNGAPRFERHNVGANFELGIQRDLRAYGFVTYGYQDGVATAPYQRPVALPSDIRRLDAYANGFQPTVGVRTQTLTASTGLRYGDENDRAGSYDLNLTHGFTNVDYRNVYSVNTSFPASAARTSGYGGSLRNIQTTLQLDNVHRVDLGLGVAPATLSVGANLRREKLVQLAGDPYFYQYGGRATGTGDGDTPYGAKGWGAFSPEDAGITSRNVFGVYADLEQQVTQKAQLGLAARSEKYSDFGWTTTGKVSGRYDFTPAVALRGAISTGFRAPSLSQFGYARTEATTYLNNPTVVKLLHPDSAVAQALGASNLQPEKATNFSAGWVLRPSNTAAVTIDAYQIEIKDQVEMTDTINGGIVPAITQRYGYPNLTGVRFFSNALDTRTRGVDISYRQKFDLAAYGDLNLGAGFSYNKTTITRVHDNPSILQGTGVVLFGRQALGLITDAAPKDKFTLSAAYRVGAWTVNADTVRYGKYKIYGVVGATNQDQTFGAQWVANLKVSYRYDSRLTVFAGANNLFNSYPDELVAASRVSSGGLSRYSHLAPAGAEGRFVFAGVNYTF